MCILVLELAANASPMNTKRRKVSVPSTTRRNVGFRAEPGESRKLNGSGEVSSVVDDVCISEAVDIAKREKVGVLIGERI